ncbi:MAG: P1 family peptidase [Mycobacteriaceae bacterium]
MLPIVQPGPLNAITDVPGILVGNHHRLDSSVELGSGWAAGSTVVRAPLGTTAGVDVRGGGPGTRETDLLDPSHTVQHVNAVLLSGGSAYGLAAADGVMRWHEERRIGIALDVQGHVVPIVPGAVIFDLPLGAWGNRPDAEFGYQAAANADTVFACGSVGAGVAARAGSLKGGLGTASVCLDSGIMVGALMVANPVGSAVDTSTGLPWGATAFGRTRVSLQTPTGEDVAHFSTLEAKGTVLNTTIGVVATNAKLSKASCKRVAVAAHDGLARAIRPAHSPLDGDTIFALATGQRLLPNPLGTPGAFPDELALLDQVCAAAALCVEQAIVHALLMATSVAGIPTYREIFPSALRD